MDNFSFHKLSYGLYVVSTALEGKDNGCIVNTLSQVTSSPAKLSVTINKNNLTSQMILQSGVFAGVILTTATNNEVIGEFGFKSGKDVDKFKNFACSTDKNGIKYLTSDIAARFSCNVIDTLDLDSHIMFIGEVTEAEILSDKDVMTYGYYHSIKKGTTPKNAPSYIPPQQSISTKSSDENLIKDEIEEKSSYICTVCGYKHTGDFSDGFHCPICGVGADKFKKI